MATLEYLIVGGGGGGGGLLAGGGGAGAVRHGTVTLSAGDYPIAVGAAGSYGEPGTNGGDSSFNGVTAPGGGFGGPPSNTGNGGDGGCGGGAGSQWFDGISWHSVNPGTGSVGYDGGADWILAGGGGGGMGGPGSPASQNLGGTGGAGLAFSTSGTSQIYAAGGGGGGQTTTGSRPACVYGGGGTSNWALGGGAAQNGVVILAYPTGTYTATGGLITTVGGNTIHTFLANGTFSVASAHTTCATAIEVPALPYDNTLTGVEATTDPNTDSPCGSGSSWAPIWYRYLVPGDVTHLGMSVTGIGGVVSVFSGSCGFLTRLNCTSSTGPELVFSVTTGVTYYFMVTNLTNVHNPLTFKLRVATTVGNDTCATATVITSLPYSNSENNANATSDPTYSDAPCGSGLSYYGVWYTYTAETGVTRIAASSIDTASDSIVTAFSGSCGTPVTQGCIDPASGELFITTIPGDPYFFLVTSKSNTPTTIIFRLRNASFPSNSFCAEFACGPTLFTGPQRRWLLHRFDIKPRGEERS